MDVNRSLRFTDDQYYQEQFTKTHIVLHHTVGGSAKSSFNYWQSTPERVGTAYIVERDGTIYEIFSPVFWAHHLGMNVAKNAQYNKQTIGIELASEGALKSGWELNNSLGQKIFDEQFVYAFDIDKKPYRNAKKLYNGTNDKSKFIRLQAPFRGYSFYDKYDEPQIVATINLINYLCETFSIPKKLISNTDKFEFCPEVLDNFSGVITHTNVRQDKSDLSPDWDWDRLESSFQ